MADGEFIVGDAGRAESEVANPYLDRVVDRVKADGGVERLNRHWSAWAWWALQRPGYWLDRAGLAGLAELYCRCAGPLLDWLDRRQAAFIVGRYF